MFVEELTRAYIKWAQNNDLEVEILDQRPGKCSLLIRGAGAWNAFKNEGGKHCIQRIPDNEKHGRPQTSIVAVSVTRLLVQQEISIDWSDIEESIQNGSGPGGQKRNRTLSCVQLKHIPTGLIVRIDSERSQHQNRDLAIEILASRLQKLQDEKIQAEQSQARQEQMCGGTRSGKRRTYNFMKGWVKDHELEKTMYDIDGFMRGKFDKLFG